MARLVLVRHGQAGPVTGNYDQLSDLGVVQTRALGEAWGRRGEPIDRLVVGPLVRHKLSLEAFILGARAAGAAPPPPEALPDLTEYPAFQVLGKGVPALVRAGDAEVGPLAALAGGEGPTAERAREELLHGVIGRWAAGELALEGVESFSAFQDRVRAVLTALTSGTEAVTVAVTSAGVIGVLVGLVLETNPARSMSLTWTIRNSSVTELVYSERTGRVSLLSFNDVSHLTEPAHITFR